MRLNRVGGAGAVPLASLALGSREPKAKGCTKSFHCSIIKRDYIYFILSCNGRFKN
jgi:hypothetical protein